MQDLTIIGLADIDRALSEKGMVQRLEFEIGKLPQVDLRTEHVMSGGMYARTITIPAGTALTGAAHKTDHLNVVMGDITVLTDEGPRRLTGLHVLATKAGMKRAGFANADTRWTTVCKTDSTDLADIEAELVEEPDRLQTRTMLAGPADSNKLEA